MEEGRSKDLLTVLYILLLIALTVLSDALFTSFISSKPEGRKTVLGQRLFCLFDMCPIRQKLPCIYFPARVNVIISKWSMWATLLHYPPFIARIILGPLHSIVTICYYYSLRVFFTFIMSLLTLKTLLMSGFIIKFERMSGDTEEVVSVSVSYCYKIAQTRNEPHRMYFS